jgi:hypothetical protein
VQRNAKLLIHHRHLRLSEIRWPNNTWNQTATLRKVGLYVYVSLMILSYLSRVWSLHHVAVRDIYLWFITEQRRMGSSDVSMICAARTLLGTATPNNMSPLYAQYEQCVRVGANITAQRVIAITSLAVPLIKPDRNEPSQNHCCGAQTSTKQTRTILLILFVILSLFCFWVLEENTKKTLSPSFIILVMHCQYPCARYNIAWIMCA